MKWMERYGHGGDIWSAAETFGGDPEDLLDFSANINPLGPPEGLMDALAASLSDVIRYPDPVCRRLTAKLADKLGLDPDWVRVGNGGAELIHLALTALAPRRTGILFPSFAEYEAAARKAESTLVPLHCQREFHFLPKPDELFDLINRVELVFIGHPNNPVGNHLPVEVLHEAAERCARTDTTLCVDEAFLDFLPEGEELSLLRELKRYPQVLLFRSLTKMYAIPGLRLGYVIGHPERISRLASRQPPWSVNALAQTAGEFLLTHDDFVRNTQAFVSRERAWLQKALERIPGVTVFPGKANFLLLHLADVNSMEVQQTMARQRILVRNCSMYPGLGEGFIRVAVRSQADNDRLARTLETTLMAIRRERGGSS